MAVDFVFERDLPLIETRLVGKLGPNELVDGTRKAIHLVESQSKYFILENCADFVDWHSMLDIYDAVELLMQSEIRFKIKKAYIWPILSEAKSKVQFWLTIHESRGIIVNAFEDRCSAIDWMGL